MSGSHGRTANAIWFMHPHVVELRAEEVSAPTANEILVRALTSGISQGTELLVLNGLAPQDLPLDLPTLKGSFGFPIKFGYANVGVVEAVGHKVTSFEAGDHVFVHHPHQSRYVTLASDAVPLDPSFDPIIATLLANMETAVNVVLDATPRLGEIVVVFGQGVVGALVAAVLETFSSVTVVRVEPSDKRRAVARNVAPAATLVTPDALPEQLAELTHGRGADLVIECSGNPAALNDAINCLAQEGTLIVASWFGLKPATIDLGGSFHRKRLNLKSSQVGNIGPDLAPRWDRSRRMDLAKDLLGSLDFNDLITHRFRFDDAPNAYILMQSDPTSVMHAVLTYGDT